MAKIIDTNRFLIKIYLVINFILRKNSCQPRNTTLIVFVFMVFCKYKNKKSCINNFCFILLRKQQMNHIKVDIRGQEKTRAASGLASTCNPEHDCWPSPTCFPLTDVWAGQAGASAAPSHHYPTLLLAGIPVPDLGVALGDLSGSGHHTPWGCLPA
jgi:hypothetical protein